MPTGVMAEQLPTRTQPDGSPSSERIRDAWRRTKGVNYD